MNDGIRGLLVRLQTGAGPVANEQPISPMLHPVFQGGVDAAYANRPAPQLSFAAPQHRQQPAGLLPLQGMKEGIEDVGIVLGNAPAF